MEKQNNILVELNTDYTAHPGLTISDFLDENDVSQKEFAEKLSCSPKHLNEIIKGKKSITPEMAKKLQLITKLSFTFWMNLQNNFDEFEENQKLAKLITDNKSVIDLYPIRDMIKKKLIPECKTVIEKGMALLSYFNLTSFDDLRNPNIPSYQPKHSKSQPNTYSIYTWLTEAHKKSDSFGAISYSRRKLKENYLLFKSFSKITEPKDFFPKIQQELLKCGVILVFVPELINSNIFGAVLLNKKKSVVIALSLRLKSNDHLWFSLFHEIGHLLLHYDDLQLKSDNSFLDYDGNSDIQMEVEANNFAANALINPERYTQFTFQGVFSKTAVETFANAIGIHPGIVVGRLQHDKYVAFNNVDLNGLKDRYEWEF